MDDDSCRTWVYSMNIISARKTHGYEIVKGPDGNVVSEADLLMCPHCGCHFKIVTGSGTRRSWCSNCVAVCCGAAECVPCKTWEAKMCEIEMRATKHLRGY